MARAYIKEDSIAQLSLRRRNFRTITISLFIAGLILSLTPLTKDISPFGFLLLAGIIPGSLIFITSVLYSHHFWIERERKKESARRGGRPVLGMPPQRNAFQEEVEKARAAGKKMIDQY